MSVANEIDKVIDTVTFINKQYNKVAEAAGTRFNIFKVLNLSTYETRTHSALLAELLNPKGDHGLGDKFLKLFLESFCEENFYKNLNISEYKVEAEKFIGPLTEDEGGRIDIILEGIDGRRIIIENKIYAADQENQLLRYYNHGANNLQRNNSTKNFELIYLTLDGKEPSVFTVGDQSKAKLVIEKVKCLSYKENILGWLQHCHKEASSLPALRESIAQYINLIKNLTGQTMNEEQLKAITDKLIRDGGESIKAVFEIRYSIYDKMVQSLKENFNWQIERLCESLKFEILTKETDNKDIYVRRTDWHNVKLGFGFWKESFYYGFRPETKKIDDLEKLKQELNFRLGDGKNSEGWLWWKYVEGYNNRENLLVDMRNGDLEKEAEKILSEIIKNTKGLEL